MASRVAGFITAVILGTARSRYPVGRLSDRADRRVVLIAFAAVGALAEVVLALGSTLSFGLVCGLGFAVGATTMVLYTLAVSHANDRAGPAQAVTVSAGLIPHASSMSSTGLERNQASLPVQGWARAYPNSALVPASVLVSTRMVIASSCSSFAITGSRCEIASMPPCTRA